MSWWGKLFPPRPPLPPHPSSFSKCHICAVRAPGRLLVHAPAEEYKNRQTQQSLTTLYLRSSSSCLFCQKLKAVNIRQLCCHLISASVDLCARLRVCVCLLKGRQPVGTDVGKVSRKTQYEPCRGLPLSLCSII